MDNSLSVLFKESSQTDKCIVHDYNSITVLTLNEKIYHDSKENKFGYMGEFGRIKLNGENYIIIISENEIFLIKTKMAKQYRQWNLGK